jgi:esterase/lipase superfamily enzyme
VDQNITLLLRVIKHIRNDLALAVHDWESFAPGLDQCLAALEKEDGDRSDTNKLFELLATRPEALRLFLRALAATGARESLLVKGTPPEFITEDAQWVTVPIYYATDRDRTESLVPNDFYGPDRGELEFGRAEVSLPFRHRRGAIERPTWWKFQFRENPAKHIVLLKVSPLALDEYVSEIRADLSQTSESSALVFVHGYYVSFADAARRAAQLSFDLEFPGVPILYSWPSNGSLLQYQVDGTNAQWSEPHFETFLGIVLEKLGVETVHVIAHSMGNRLVTETLKSFAVGESASGSGAAARLSQVVFAAPDVDSGTFVHMTEKFKSKAERFTLYASSHDTALAISRALNGYPRAGDSRDGLTLVDGVDTIDASEVDTGLFSTGHSYFGDQRSILTDMYDLLKYGAGPEGRYGLEPRFRAGKPYWWYAP